MKKTTPDTGRKNDKGLLYIVFNDPEIMKECIFSAASFKKNSPGIPVQVVTNLHPAGFNTKHFDFVDYFNEKIHPLKGKVKFMPESRFQKTLYLDADTLIKADLSELFNVLDEHDIGMTYDNLCDWNANPVKFLAQESDVVNTGFLLYKKNKAVEELLALWLSKVLPHDEKVMRPGTFGDQHFFNTYVKDRILNDNAIRYKILPNEVYNVRPWCWDKLRTENKFGNTKILHAHHLHHGFFTKLKRKISSLIS